MSTDLKGKGNKDRSRLFRSFSYAFQGVKYVITTEKNMKIHLFVTVIVVILGMVLSLSPIEWLFILFAIGGVLSLEMINTAIERTIDLVTKDYHLLAKRAKDVAAGAVLIYAILAVIVGMIIFGPKLYHIFVTNVIKIN
ncbi:diacylglycerol kinase family protein [Bacillus aquiflavi]|uniref:Diacylglycerol kinase family protein n=1 Tax=Bacillus aquiflavi TaxID=2672567 RepID=A0A6B3VWT0_9BACI|nr:diacylglycerol kinase family protein [Bacillus aquiflavi]MBA4535868.1 diacylglycerol kinase family protein [Bacillus aquiflavi]NEY80243.1 diacylglycerol kinase family protein [Bacillus aquiflavi]UAC47289.1 diacylglycerol kinase family protein [Bacillus aquiflavi]